MPDSLIATRKQRFNLMTYEQSILRQATVHPNPRMFNMYSAMPSKAHMDADTEQASMMEERESLKVFD